MMMKISIIIPVYNVEPYIASCLKSVINQSYPHIECIIIDDCGTDRSMDIVRNTLKSYQGNIEFKLLNYEQNKGTSAARNVGIKKATGDYLYFLDSDDELPKTSINDLVDKTIEYNQPDIVVGEYDFIPTDNIKHLHIDKEYLDNKSEIIYTFCKAKWYVMSWNKLVRKDFIISNQLYFKEGVDLHEDDLWSFQSAIKCRNIVFTKQSTYLYRIRPGSMIRSKYTQKNVDCFMAFLSYIDSVRHTLNNKDVHTYFETSVVGLATRMYKENLKEKDKNIDLMRKSLDLSLLNPIKRKDLKGILKLLVFYFPPIFIPIYLRLLFYFKK